MESKEIKNLDYIKKLTSLYFRTLKPSNDQTETNIAQIKFLNYSEMGCVITDMLKLCILALNQNAHLVSGTNKSAIDVSLILETVLQMIPNDEFDFLSEINYMFLADAKSRND